MKSGKGHMRRAPCRLGRQRPSETGLLEVLDLSDLCLFLFLACCCFFLVVELPSCAVLPLLPLEPVTGLAELPD